MQYVCKDLYVCMYVVKICSVCMYVFMYAVFINVCMYVSMGSLSSS